MRKRIHIVLCKTSTIYQQMLKTGHTYFDGICKNL